MLELAIIDKKGTFAEKASYNINKQYHRGVENFAPQILSSLAISLLPDEILDNTEFGKSVKKHSRDIDEFDTLHYEGSAFKLGYFDKGKYYQMKDSKGKDITVEIDNLGQALRAWSNNFSKEVQDYDDIQEIKSYINKNNKDVIVNH